MDFITIGALPLTISADLDAPTRFRVLRVLPIFSLLRAALFGGNDTRIDNAHFSRLDIHSLSRQLLGRKRSSSDPPSSFCLKRQSVLWSATDSERSKPINRRNNRSRAKLLL